LGARKVVAIKDYQPLARQAGITGEVEVRCFLNPDGSVARAEAVSGHPLLKEQARQNALLWKFRRTSAKEGGNNTITLRYEYVLEGKPQYRTSTKFVVNGVKIRITAHPSVVEI
jgi:TonB family protein